MENRRTPIIQRGKPAVAGMDDWHSREFLYHHLRNANLHERGSTDKTAKDLRFNSNEQFWNRVLPPEYSYGNRISNIGLRWVELLGFQIIDWFPRTPGLYYTGKARQARQEAEHYISEQNGILFYEPRGKTHMMEGGIGSVKFKPVVIRDSDYWLCTATSDGFCHSGIPLAIPNEIFDDINFQRQYKITGQVRFLPDFLENHFRHMSNIPQLYVEVDNLASIGNDKKPTVSITPMVFFSGGREMELEKQENVTYVTCHADSFFELNKAIEWLVWYVDKYHGEIITNFDQQQPLFANVPFSLQNVMEGKLRAYDLQRYHIEQATIICEKVENLHAEIMNMTKIKVNLGDGTTIHGDFVVANTIKDSFNKAEKANIPNELKDTLKELAKAVATMSEKLPTDTAQQVARDLDMLTSEATSNAPRQQWWQLSIEGLKKAAKDIGEIGKPVLELAAKIVAILSAL